MPSCPAGSSVRPPGGLSELSGGGGWFRVAPGQDEGSEVFQLAPDVPPVGHDAGQECVKTRAVVHLEQMGRFMEKHIVDAAARRFDEVGVERQRSQGGTAPPAAPHGPQAQGRRARQPRHERADRLKPARENAGGLFGVPGRKRGLHLFRRGRGQAHDKTPGLKAYCLPTCPAAISAKGRGRSGKNIQREHPPEVGVVFPRRMAGRGK